MSAITTDQPVELVIARLNAHGCNPTQRGDTWQARCPSHEDHNPSLSLAPGNDGRALLTCHAGCELEDVLAALQLVASDLFTPKPERAKRRIIATYDYHDRQGALVFQVVRFDPKDFRQRRPNGHGAWLWNLGPVERVLYRLPAVLEAVAGGHLVWITEGEKDADALQAVLPPGEVATTNPGGAKKWRQPYTRSLEGAGVMIWADADDTGRAHAATVAAELNGHVATLHVVQSPRFKDAAEHLGAGLTPDDIIEINLDALADDALPLGGHEDGWDRVDLGSILDGIRDGTVVRPMPEVGRVEGVDAGLLVRGKVNGIHGAQTTGKTLTAEVIACQELAAGNTVWFLDFEDDPISIAMRFHELGADLEAVRSRLIYRRPAQVLTLERQAQLTAALEADQPALVIVDSTGEWMGLHGVEDKDLHVARFMNACMRPLTATGAAGLLLDHVPHADKDRLAPIGSVRKINSVNGCQYLITTVAEMARGRIGKARLTVAKDRTGTRAKGTVAAEVLIDSTGDTIDATIIPPTTDDRPDSGPLAALPPAARRVHAVLDPERQLTTTTIGDLVAEDQTTGTGLKSRTIQDALKRLEEAGLAVRHSLTGVADLWSPALPDPDGQENTP